MVTGRPTLNTLRRSVNPSLAPTLDNLLLCTGGRSGNAGGELRGGGKLHRIHLVAGVGGGEDQPQIRLRIVKSGDQSKCRNAGQREIGMVRIGHQGPDAADLARIRLRDLEQKRLEVGKAAGQSSKSWAARDAIEIDVQSDRGFLRFAEARHILSRP